MPRWRWKFVSNSTGKKDFVGLMNQQAISFG